MSEKALGSPDKALKINWGRDVVETSPGSFLLHALSSRVKMDQLPHGGDPHELSPEAATAE